MTVAQLELDLEVFSGPFDLLLTLVLREEVDLLEVDLADVVIGYLDHLEARGELDLEVATEFLVLVAALPRGKARGSRSMGSPLARTSRARVPLTLMTVRPLLWSEIEARPLRRSARSRASASLASVSDTASHWPGP